MKQRERTQTAVRRRSKTRTILLTVLAAAAAIVVVAALVMLSRTPPELSDEAALAMLPAGAELLERHEQDCGRARTIEYRYTQEYAFCLVERMERALFRYEGSAWSLDGAPEVLAEAEDWSDLAGYWTERTEGPKARFLRVRVDAFGGGALEGQVLYEDAAGECAGQAEEFFLSGERLEDGGPWLLHGTGYFRYDYLRVDRDGGVYFDNDVRPMARGDLPSEPPSETAEPEPGEEPEQPLPQAAEPVQIVVTEELSVRRTPDADGEPVAEASVGEVLSGAETEDGWYQVERGGVAGYVPGGGVLALAEDMTVGVADVWADVNVRAGPGQEYEALGVAAAGTRLVYTGVEENWYRVIYEGRTAYVSGGYVTAEPPEE